VTRARRWLPHAYLLALLAALFVPGGDGPPLGEPLDKLLHLGCFALWTALWRWCDRPRGWVVALAVLVVASASELVQHLVVPGRHGDWLDLVADGTGAGLGWLVATWGAADKNCPKSDS